MFESDKLFAGSIPENYDRYIVPADFARRAASLSPYAVLEAAVGSGVVTRALAQVTMIFSGLMDFPRHWQRFLT
jgi:hypothetical protein